MLGCRHNIRSLLIGGLVLFFLNGFRPAIGSPPGEGEGAWPMFLYNAERTGGPGPIPDNPEVLWQFPFPGPQGASSPSLSDQEMILVDSEGGIYCVDLRNGKPKWKKLIKGCGGQAVISGGNIYVGVRARMGGELLCLSLKDGSEIWKTRIPGKWVFSPVFYRGKIYCVAGFDDNEVYCLDSISGKIGWSRRAKGIIKTSLLPMAGSIYFGTHDKYVYCLSAEDGTPNWERHLPDKVAWSVSGDGENIYFSNHNKYLYCLNGRTGKEIWKVRLLETENLTPVLADGRLLFGSPDRKIHCLSAATGKEIWSCLMSDPITSAPAVNEGKILMGLKNGDLICLSLSEGNVQWRKRVQTDLNFSPVIGRGVIIVATVGRPKQSVYCLGEAVAPGLE